MNASMADAVVVGLPEVSRHRDTLSRPDSMMLLAGWDQFMAAQDLSVKTRESYGYSMLRLMRRRLGRHVLDFTEADIAAFMASMGLRSHSKHLYVRGIHSFYGWATSHRYLDLDPSAAIRPRAPVDPPPEAFTEQELTRLLVAAAWRDPRRAWAIMACYALGTRRSELCAIRAEDIDWDRGRVYLRFTKGNRPRHVEMGPLAKEALGELVKIAQHPGKRGELCRRCGLGPVRSLGRCGACYQFLHKYGVERPADLFGAEPVRVVVPDPPPDVRILPIEPNTLSEWMSRAAKDAGLPPGKKQHVHTLRATFATKLLGEGVPISVVSRLLGHAQIGTTARYLAVTDDDRRRAVDVL